MFRWIAGGLTTLVAGLLCGLAAWSAISPQLMPDLSERPAFVVGQSTLAAK